MSSAICYVLCHLLCPLSFVMSSAIYHLLCPLPFVMSSTICYVLCHLLCPLPFVMFSAIYHLLCPLPFIICYVLCHLLCPLPFVMSSAIYHLLCPLPFVMSSAIYHSLSSTRLTFVFKCLTAFLNEVQMKKRSNISINVILRRVRAVEKQYILHILIRRARVCVCSLIYRTCRAHEPYYKKVKQFHYRPGQAMRAPGS
jgi:hypothetical protein